MTAEPRPWDSQQVAGWLEARIEAAARDQVAADRKGYDARDDYDLAAAEEWACRALMATARQGDQAALAQKIKQLLAQDEYRITGIHDDRRTERHIRAHLRKIAKMAKANEGFENRLRYQ